MPRSCPPLRPDRVGWHGRRVSTRLRLILERVFWFVNRCLAGGEGDLGFARGYEGDSVRACAARPRCRRQTALRFTRCRGAAWSLSHKSSSLEFPVPRSPSVDDILSIYGVFQSQHPRRCPIPDRQARHKLRVGTSETGSLKCTSSQPTPRLHSNLPVPKQDHLTLH